MGGSGVPGRPRNILHTVRSLRVDGVVKVILRNLEHHDRTRFRHFVCALRRETSLVPEFTAAGVTPVFLDHTTVSRIPASLAAAGRLLRELQIDLVHANRTSDLAMMGAAARQAGIPVVSTIHWLGRLEDHPHEDSIPYVLRWSSMATNVVLNRTLAQRVIAVSHAVRESFASLPGFPVDRMSVVYPGLDMHVPQPDAAAVAGLRASLGLAPGAPVLLNVGRLQAVKGQRYLAPAMAIIRERHPDAVLLVAGAGELLDDLTAQARAAGVGDAIRFLGVRSDVDTLLALCDVLILTSDSEAAPLPLFEAMRAGRPAVATRVGGVTEIIRDGVTGRIVERANPAAIAAGVLDVLARPDRGREMGERARRLGVEEFDIRRSVRRIEDIYDQLLPVSSFGARV